MNKPRIGIAGNIFIMPDGIFPGMYRTYVNHNYVTSIEKAGGIPVLLPVLDDPEDVQIQMENLDGMLLPGGYDVDPQLYGEDIQPSCGMIMREVDDFTIRVTHIAAAKEIPLFAVCKGIQILNVAFGGTLWQDQTSSIPGCLKHVQAAPRGQGTHDIEILPDSFLGSVLGTHYRVNSFHHQSVKKTAEGFRVTARSSDGIIEGIERKEGSFMAGVQFHPEMMAEYGNPKMLSLFQAFIEICGRNTVER